MYLMQFLMWCECGEMGINDLTRCIKDGIVREYLDTKGGVEYD